MQGICLIPVRVEEIFAQRKYHHILDLLKKLVAQLQAADVNEFLDTEFIQDHWKKNNALILSCLCKVTRMRMHTRTHAHTHAHMRTIPSNYAFGL